MQDSPILAQDPYSMFLFALKAPETRRKYTGHLDTFLEFIDDISNSTPKSRHRRTELDLKRIREKCRFFVEEARRDNNWVLYKVVEFLQFLRDQVDKKEIVAGTLKNYIKPSESSVKCLKLTCPGRESLEVFRGPRDLLQTACPLWMKLES